MYDGVKRGEDMDKERGKCARKRRRERCGPFVVKTSRREVVMRGKRGGRREATKLLRRRGLAVARLRRLGNLGTVRLAADVRGRSANAVFGRDGADKDLEGFDDCERRRESAERKREGRKRWRRTLARDVDLAVRREAGQVRLGVLDDVVLYQKAGQRSR